MSEIVGCFNERAQKLLDLHLASGVRKYYIWFKGKLQGNHVALIQEGKDLVTYAMINATAIRKILKKYDKVCPSHTLWFVDLYSFWWMVEGKYAGFYPFYFSVEYRFITLSKGRHSSHKLKACIWRSFSPLGYVNLWLFISIYGNPKPSPERPLPCLMDAPSHSMMANHHSLVNSLIRSSSILTWLVLYAW